MGRCGVNRRAFFATLFAAPLAALSAMRRPNVRSLLTDYYQKAGYTSSFLKRIRANCCFMSLEVPKELPLRSGKTIQFFKYQLEAPWNTL